MKVSVVIPCYNEEAYLKDALESIKNQTYKGKIEIIVVDDGSTDKSVEIAESYGAKVLKNEKNMGIAITRNRGIKEAKGKYLAFLSADDFFHKTYVEKMFHYAEKNPGKVLFSDYYIVNENKIVTGIYRAPDFETQKDFALACWNNAMRNTMFVNLSTTFAETKIWKENPFWEELRFGEDLEWVLRMSLIKKYEFLHIKEPLLYYRVHPSSTTSQKLAEIPANNVKILNRIRGLAK